ncbi:MAG TPA: carboxylating nicotinate-nucleotide diphosphorylase [Ignavibacteriaceae bacterium]
MNFNDSAIIRLIDLAIEEDVGSGDITTNSLVSKNESAEAIIKVKQDGIIAGLKIAQLVVDKFDSKAKWNFKKVDGNYCKSGDVVASVQAHKRALLTSERTLLNFLQRMSGIATKTRKFVDEINGFNTKILDTRKTVPGHRILDKYAVKVGGGTNHRIGLFDMVLIKDNHIKIAGGIKNAVESVKKKNNSSVKIEVEANTIEQVVEALVLNVDIIMLDNMSIQEMKQAVNICKEKVLTEASGNVSLANVKLIAETGVDFISVGELTHSVEALDISMKVK